MVRQFSNIDRVKWSQHLHIRWEMVETPDESAGPPDDMDDGFWPSQDPRAPGYVGKVSQKEFDDQLEKAKSRYHHYQCGNWAYIGIIARAHLFIPQGGQSFFMLTIDSAGLWSIEDDSDGEYKKEVFEEQKQELLEHIKTLNQQLDTAIILKD